MLGRDTHAPKPADPDPVPRGRRRPGPRSAGTRAGRRTSRRAKHASRFYRILPDQRNCHDSYSPYLSRVHSQTLPCMSYRPSGFGLFLLHRLCIHPIGVAVKPGMAAKLALIVAERPGACGCRHARRTPTALRSADHRRRSGKKARACSQVTVRDRSVVALRVAGEPPARTAVGRFAGSDLEPRQGDDARRFDDLVVVGHRFAPARTHREAARTDRDPLDAVRRRRFRPAVDCALARVRENAPGQTGACATGFAPGKSTARARAARSSAATIAHAPGWSASRRAAASASRPHGRTTNNCVSAFSFRTRPSPLVQWLLPVLANEHLIGAALVEQPDRQLSGGPVGIGGGDDGERALRPALAAGADRLRQRAGAQKDAGATGELQRVVALCPAPVERHLGAGGNRPHGDAARAGCRVSAGRRPPRPFPGRAASARPSVG
jgi:hypothetical protein